MKIPTVREAPEDFITRVAALLQQPDTHVYFDTSILLWVTLLAPEARAQFLSFLNFAKAPAHVPTWAMNEFYRFHRDNFLQKQLNEAADALGKSIKEFSQHAKRYGAQSPLAEATFVERVARMAKEANELKRIASEWKYETPARETIEWMNGIACKKGIEFDLLGELKRIGVARYSHDIPPGYEDDHKKARDKRASNRFGDLLFWQEVLAHAVNVTARTVIIVTNDRKEDWYFKQGEPDVGKELRQLGVDKWRPVPSPHPLLTYEMNDVAEAELVLVDHLYFGALAWHVDKKNLRKFVGAALAISEDNMDRAEAPPAAAPIQGGGSLSPVQAYELLRDAFATPNPPVQAVLAQLEDEADKAEALIASMDQAFVAKLSETDTVVLARTLGDMSFADHPMALQAVDRLLDLVPLVSANHAACIHLGTAVASYYNGAKPRSIPNGRWIERLVDYQGQEAVRHTVTKLHTRLGKDTSPALYLLNAQDAPCEIVLDLDTRREQDPSELMGARVNGTAVLTNEAVQGPALRDLVGAAIASSQQIAEALCTHFALPRRKVRLADADVRRTVPAELYLRILDRTEMLLEKNNPVAELEVDIGNSGLDDDELVDPQDIEFEDGDDAESAAGPLAGDEGEGG